MPFHSHARVAAGAPAAGNPGNADDRLLLGLIGHVLEPGAARPALLEQPLHGLAHALMVEDHGGPGGPRDDGSSRAIMPRWPSNTASFMGSDSAWRTSMPAVSYSTAFAVLVVERAGLDEQPAD